MEAAQPYSLTSFLNPHQHKTNPKPLPRTGFWASQSPPVLLEQEQFCKNFVAGVTSVTRGVTSANSAAGGRGEGVLGSGRVAGAARAEGVTAVAAAAAAGGVNKGGAAAGLRKSGSNDEHKGEFDEDGLR
jgi:hypothetical protein